MKLRIIFCLLVIRCLSAPAQEPEYDHIFFDNSLMTGRYYYSKADYTSPSYIQNILVHDKNYIAI